MSATITIKRGATFALSVAATNPDGTPFDLTGLTITSWLRDIGQVIIAELTVSIISAVGGLFSVTGPSTATWPLGSLTGDFRIVGAAISLSDTFVVLVLLEVTDT